MEGVTILQVIENTYLNSTSEHIMIGAVVVGLIAVFLTAVFGSEFGLNNGWTIASIILLSSCLVLLILEVTCGERVTDITYRVLVDSSVDMNKFFSKYELIRTEGLIYVVREIGSV